MAVSLLTTLYGAPLANLVFIPIAAKLEEKTESEIFIKQVMIEGVVGIQSGKIPATSKVSSSSSAQEKTGVKDSLRTRKRALSMKLRKERFERRNKPEHSGGSPRWMVTFADLITLILVFFILLFRCRK